VWWSIIRESNYFLKKMIEENKDSQITFIDRIIEKMFLWAIPMSVTPNQVTVLRFMLTPVVGWLFFKEMYFLGLVLFAIAMLTDALDGAMARIRNQITDLGKMIDPLADKFVMATAVIMIIFKFSNVNIAIAIIVLDILIMVKGGIGKYFFKQKIQAEIFGKLKLIAQVIGVLVLLVYILLGNNWILQAAEYILIGAIILAGISLLRPKSV
jgi:CDP-diacylglycerol--glycerol-3-phosphate 3-phosphatidyltransferase